MKLPIALSSGLIAVVLTTGSSAYAAESPTVAAGRPPAPTANASGQWPTTLPMPKGVRPEGIAIKGSTAYVTSSTDGSVYRIDLRTGKRQVLTPATGVGSLGVMLDNQGRLFVAGGYSGTVRVIDSHSGKVQATYQLAKDTNTAVNDFAFLDGALYVTDPPPSPATATRST